MNTGYLEKSDSKINVKNHSIYVETNFYGHA